MQPITLEPGKSYFVGTGKTHAIDVLQIVEEPGWGTVALSAYYHVDEPHNRQFELYQLDGLYRADRTPDPAWDVVGERPKPKPDQPPLEMVAPTGIYNAHGEPMNLFAPNDYLERFGSPPMKILPQERLDGYKRLIIREAQPPGKQPAKPYSDDVNYDENDQPVN